MAKREFIDKTEVNMYIDTIYERNCNINEAYTELDLVDTISEQDIVKPYLEKLKEEIQKEENILYHDCEADFSKSYDVIRTDTVIELIDNLLTEKGTEK